MGRQRIHQIPNLTTWQITELPCDGIVDIDFIVCHTDGSIMFNDDAMSCYLEPTCQEKVCILKREPIKRKEKE